MIAVTKTIWTETAHRLIDYEGKCAHIHGHSYRWEVEAVLNSIVGVDHRGISVDFGDLKQAMMECIDRVYDHALVLCTKDPLAAFAWQMDPEGGEQHPFAYAADGTPQKIEFMPDNPTAENMAVVTADRLQRWFSDYAWKKSDPCEVTITRIRVWETQNSYAEWNREIIGSKAV